MILNGINIFSGNKQLLGLGAALTNPTEMSFKKETIKNHYPVVFKGKEYADAETAYKTHKTNNLEADMRIMTEIIKTKLQQHPPLLESIEKCGGVEWLERCSHVVGVRGSRWEGYGRRSNFILCLIAAFETVNLPN